MLLQTSLLLALTLGGPTRVPKHPTSGPKIGKRHHVQPAPICPFPHPGPAPYCRGRPPEPDYVPPTITVCDFCLKDSDCTARAGGHCDWTSAGVPCMTSVRVCRYRHDACDGCHQVCLNDSWGRVRCVKPPPAPPTRAPPGR